MTLEEGSAVDRDIPVAGMEEKLGEETQAQKVAHQIALLIEEVAVLLSVRDEPFAGGRMGHRPRNCRQQGRDNGASVEPTGIPIIVCRPRSYNSSH